jgi:plastocyanin
MSNPTLTIVTIASNNTIKTNYAGDDNVVTLNIVASEDIIQPTVSFTSGDNGVSGAVTYSGSNTDWTAQYTVSSTDTNGLIEFAINFQSTGGNNGLEVISTTNSSSVTKVQNSGIGVITQIGNSIPGSINGDLTGYSVAFNRNGNIVAIGAPNNGNGGTHKGEVRVYQVTGSTWSQIGGDLNGVNDNDHFGHSVDLNGDGTILTIGTKDPLNSLFIYNYNGSSWNTYGDTIYFNNNTAFENSISHITKGKLNYDGTKLLALNYNVGYSLVTTTITEQINNTSPYYYCTANFDFRTNSSDNVIDSIGNVECVFNNTTSTTTDGLQFASSATNVSAATTKYATIKENLVIGGEGSYEFYMKVNNSVNWCTFFEIHNIQFQRQQNETFYMFMASSGGAYLDINTTLMNSGNYHHFVITVSANKNYSIYVDNDRKLTGVTFSNMDSEFTTTNASQAYFGTNRNKTGGFNGYMKYFRYYHNHVLSQAEVNDLYNDRDDIINLGTEESNIVTTTTAEIPEYRYNASIESYEYSSSTWNQIGNTIQSNSVNDISGGDIAINDAGNTIVIGYPQTNSATGTTKVFKYDTTDISWNQVGSDIDGYATGDYAGTSVIMDGTGDYVAIGSPYNGTGKVSIYNYNSSNWSKLGNDINGSTTGDNFGYSIALSNDASNIAIGAPNSSNNTGHVNIYEYRSQAWNQIGSSILGSENGETFGYSISYNDGVNLAIGVPNIHNESSDSGHVDLYKLRKIAAVPPVLVSDSVSIVSNNTDTTKAKITDEITLSFEYDLSINTPMVSFKSNGQDITDTSIDYLGTNDNTSWTAKYTVDSADTDGAVTFTIDASAQTTLTDATQLTQSDITDGTNVTVDTTIPTITGISINSDNTILTVTFSEDVFTNTDGTGDLTTSDFTVSGANGVATLTSVDSITRTNDSIYDLNLTILGTANGEEILTVIPASSTSIYDAAGNAMSTTQSNNSVNLTDLALPTINTLTISSNNSIKNNYAGENDIVTLNIVASEDIITPTVVFKSNDVVVTNTVSYSGAGDSWTAQYTVSSDDTNGVISFELNIEDVAGNTNQRTQTTDSSSVIKVENSTTTSSTQTTTTIGSIVNSGTLMSGTSSTELGTSCAISDDCNTVVAGGKKLVRVWKKSGSIWEQTANLIENINNYGCSVSINGNGTIIAVGAKGYSSSSGAVYMYKYNGSTWESFGANSGIIGDGTGDYSGGSDNNDYFGQSVSLNYSGNRVAVSAPFADGLNNAKNVCGQIYIYEYNDSTLSSTTDTWNLSNNDVLIAGSLAQTRLGEYQRSVNLNRSSDETIDGKYLVVSATDIDTAMVWENNSGSWQQKGQTLSLDGFSCAINENGTIIAVSKSAQNGFVYLYYYNETSSNWELEHTIEKGNGQGASHNWGICIDINNIGNIFILGANYGNYAQLYKYSNTDITQSGSWSNTTISPSNSDSENFAGSVFMSGDGSHVVMGDAYGYDDNRGYIEVYETGEPHYATNTTYVAAIPPELVSDSVSIVSNNYDTTKAKAIDEVTLSFEYDLSINTPMVSFFSDGVNVTDSEIDYVGTNDNTSWTAKYTVDAADTDGVVTFTIDASAQTTATDATQLTQVDITDGTNVTVDTTIPTITGTTISSNNVNLQVTFSEFVVNNSSYTDAGLSYTVTANGSSNYILNGSGLTDSAKPSISLFVGQTVTFSVSSSVNSSHPLIIGTVAESNDNNDIITTSDSRLTSTVDGDNTLISFTPYDNGTFHYYCDYHSAMGNSIDVTGGLEPSDFTVEITGGGVATVAANPTSLSSTNNTLFDLTLDVTNASSADGNEVLTVKPTNATSIFDKVGNPMVVEQSNNTVNLNDKTLPTAAITYTLDGVASTGPFGDGDIVVIIATFDEDMLDSNNVNLIITGTGSVTSETVTMTRVNATEYNYNYTPPVSQNGSASLQVSGGTDLAGNAVVNTPISGDTFNIVNDTTPPTAAITYSYAGPYKNGGTNVTITATFNEDMAEEPVPQIIITGTDIASVTPSDMTKVSVTEYSYEYIIPTGDGTGTITLSTGTDLAGNVITSVPTSGDTFTVDNTAPTAAITYSYAGPYKNGGSNVIITATFNEDMADSLVPKINITGTGIANVEPSDMTKVSVTEYTYEYIIPTGDGTGTITLSTGTDLAGNLITSVPTSGDTFTVDNTAPTISSTSLLADNSTITVTFSDNVYNAADDTRSDLETSDFALSIITGDGIATLQSATPSSINKKSEQEYDLTINYTPGSVARGNEILKVVPLTTSIFDLAGNAASDAQDNADNKVTLNDTEAPTVTSVTTTTAAGSYNDASPFIPIKVTFSENVLVDTTNGTPQLTLSIGGSGYSIYYASGSESSELIFNYTILDGHNETNLDYEGTGSLAFSGGTITDAAGNDADLTLPAPGASGSISENKVIVIDTTRPNVVGVTSTKPDGSYRQGEVIDIEIEFTESVDVTGIPQLELEMDGDNVSVDYASGSGSKILVFQYTVGSNENSDNLDYSAAGSLSFSGGTIKDSANNNAALTLPSPGATNSLGHNQNIVIDNTAPTVIDINATTANGTYRVGTVIPIEVFFSETVIVVGIPQITLAFDDGTKAVNYTDGTNSNRLVFNYTIENGENTNNLDYSAAGSLSFSGGTIKDVAGNDADLALFSPGAPGSLGDNKQLVIDTTSPTVVSFTIYDSALNKYETATVTLEFSEAVSDFDSDIDITTTNGTLSKMTSSDNIIWTGTFTPTDDSESSTNSLTLSNNYTDIVGNGGITATTANFSVDTLTASVTSFVLDDTSLTKGETAGVILVFSEAVSGFDSSVDITVQNGVLSQMTSENNSSWTGTFTPTDDIDDTTGLLTLADTYTDVAGNTGVSATTATFGIDTKLPTVATFALANSSLSSGSTTTVSLVFSEAVSGFNSNDDITTENGTLTQMTSNDNNITWTGTFTPSVDIEDTSNTLTLQTSLKDVAGNQIASQTYTSNYVIDTLIPTVNNVTASNAPGTYKEGDVIAIEVYFSETVNVTVATPYIEISVGGNTVNVNYTSGSSTNILTFEYTVQSGITETTGINYAASNSLKFNGAEIKDNYGNNAVLTLPATDSANSLLGNKTIFIDTTPATIDSVALAADNTYITVSFNEYVFNTESGSGDLETTDFTLDITGGTANFSGDITSSPPSNITVIDNRSFRLFMSFNGLPSGDEVVTVNPASNSIFDIAGNASTTTQTGNEVTLNDQALPILTTVEISSTNDSTNFAKVGDVVTLNIVANETLYNTPTIELRSGGNLVTNTVNIAGTEYTTTFQFSYTIHADDREGDITFKISNYVDRNSNIGLDVITLTSGSTITVDKVVPTLTNVTYSTSNASALQSKVGDTITLDITASEIISAPTVDFKTNGVTHTTQTMNGSGDSYTSSFVTSDSHADGDITFTISDISDQANNEGVNVNTVTSGNTLIFDKTAPTFSNLSLTSSNSVNTISKDTDVVTLVMTSSEDLTAPPTVLFKSGTTDLTTVTATQPDVSDDTQFSASFTVSNTHVDGEIAYVISNFTDVAGNAGTTYTENSSGVFIDNTSPTITSVAVDGNNTQIELTLSEEVYSNSNGSGVLATTDVYLVLTGGTTASLSYPYPSAITPIGGNLSRYTLTIDTILQGSVQGSEVITITPTVDSMYDSAGNVASVTQSNNTVQLNDTSLPSMTTVSISSDNGNPSLAKAENTITLDLICDESVSVPTVSFYSGPNADDINGSVTITPDSGNNTTYTATYVVDSNDTDGNITFSVSNFQDANGNTGNAATIVTDSTSVTVDTTEPTFSSITMSSNNNVDNQYAKGGRTITLDIQANENINTPTVSFTSNGNPINGSVTVAGSDDSYTASYVVQGNDTDGLVGFEISNISDLIGNTASNISTLTSGSGVTVDKVAPNILSATIASNNDNTSFAKVGETIQLTITADESITSPTVEFTINEQSVADANSVTVTGNGTTYTAEYTISSSDSEGLVGFTISSYTDLARNNGPTVSATTDSSQVTVDNTLPTLTTVSIASNNSVSNTAAKSNDKITLTIEASEDITAPTVTMNSGGQGLTNAGVVSGTGDSYTAEFTVDSGDKDGNCTFTISGYEDNAGNAGLGVTAVTDGTSVKVDNTPPKVYTTSLDPTSVGASGTVVTVTFTEEVSGFALDDVTANEGVVSDLNTNDNITYTFKYTPNSNYSATSEQKIIEIGTNYVDLAGNQAVSSAPINSVLTTAASSNPIENIILTNINSEIDPDITSSSITTVVTTTGLPNNVDAEIVQTVAGVDLNDLNNATKTQLISQLEDEYANYQLNIAPERVSVALTSGSVVITTTIASVDAVTGSAITVDATGPSVDFFSYSGNSLLKKGETAYITVSFSEAIDSSTFTSDTINAPDASISSISGNGAIWNFILTPDDNVESTNNAITILGTYTDLVGNSGTEYTSWPNAGVRYSVDTLSPTPTITASNTTIQDTETADITITFNEAVNGFNNDDVTVTNGSLTTFTSNDGNITWTATFTPTTAGVAQIQVNSGSYFDSALNQGTAASLSITVEGVVVFTDEPDECLPDSLNNNTLTGVKSMPLKDGSSNNDASFALGRKLHTSRMLFTNSNTTTKLTKKWSYNRDASSVIARRKAGSMGASLNKTGGKISFTSPNDHNTVDRALQRVRAGGAVVPKKSANNK